MAAAANGEAWTPLTVRPDTTAATVVVAANGYPADPVKGVPIPDVIDLDQVDVRVLHAGTTRTADGHLVSSGGRVLNVVGVGADLDQALRKAYTVVDDVTSNTELFARSDIGWRHATGERAGSLR
ncbi:MAG: phosphoribosylglycinamide synthetase C domain-containing protein [Acidimicrobiales bacterium]